MTEQMGKGSGSNTAPATTQGLWNSGNRGLPIPLSKKLKKMYFLLWLVILVLQFGRGEAWTYLGVVLSDKIGGRAENEVWH